MRIALIVGINHYTHTSPLFGCVNDAQSVRTVLERHGDGAPNFDCRIMTASGPHDAVHRQGLKDQVEKLFETPADIALFHFAGHGHIEVTGGYVLASDATRGDEGLPLSDILVFADRSKAKNRIILLDSCHGGIAGNAPTQNQAATIAEGVTVLTASTADQYASETNGRGVFTELLVDALHGGAADLMGHITPGSVYAHIDQSLSAWEQRPVFKTNVSRFVSLRDVPARIERAELRRITEFFPAPSDEFPLDPTYEPEPSGRGPLVPPPIAEHTAVFSILQRYNRLNLLVPVGAPHMWHAAMESKACRLTVLGAHYHRLVSKGRI